MWLSVSVKSDQSQSQSGLSPTQVHSNKHLPSYQSMRGEREQKKSRSALQPISLTPAPRPPSPRSASALLHLFLHSAPPDLYREHPELTGGELITQFIVKCVSINNIQQISTNATSPRIILKTDRQQKAITSVCTDLQQFGLFNGRLNIKHSLTHNARAVN